VIYAEEYFVSDKETTTVLSGVLKKASHALALVDH
jgi:hypothetical protein